MEGKAQGSNEATVQRRIADGIANGTMRIKVRRPSNVGQVIDVEEGCNGFQFRLPPVPNADWRLAYVSTYGNVSGITPFKVVTDAKLAGILDNAVA